MHYLMVVRVPSYRVDAKTVALESAFREHLIVLKRSLGQFAEQLTVIVPTMSTDRFHRDVASLSHINEDEHGIRFVLLHPETAKPIKYNIRYLPTNFYTIYKECANADIIHAGRDFPTNIFNFLGSIAAALHHKHLIFVVNIDNRPSGKMMFESGLCGWRHYLLDKWMYTPLTNLQIRFASRFARLLLVKGQSLARDFGNGRAVTKSFLNTVHDDSQVISLKRLAIKHERQANRSHPLQAVYFGRIIQYKGIDHSIRAVHKCRKHGANVSLKIIGNGPDKPRLEALVDELHMHECVSFQTAVPYARVLEIIYHCDVLLATPLSSDTPRSAIDAMSQGLCLAAYRTPYYSDLVESGAVLVTPWNSVAGIATSLEELDSNREKLTSMSANAVVFATNNTNTRWIEQRSYWTKKYCTPSYDRSACNRA